MWQNERRTKPCEMRRKEPRKNPRHRKIAHCMRACVVCLRCVVSRCVGQDASEHCVEYLVGSMCSSKSKTAKIEGSVLLLCSVRLYVSVLLCRRHVYEHLTHSIHHEEIIFRVSQACQISIMSRTQLFEAILVSSYVAIRFYNC